MPSAVSAHAGTFLCNQVYHQALRWARRLRSAPRVAFVHLPAIPGVEPGPHVDEDALFLAVQAIAAELAVPGSRAPRVP
jgi:pyrrolidone-carboxylate peptidase